MALELGAETIGAAAIEALRRRQPGLVGKAEQALAWLRDVAEPPSGVELRCNDGAAYTGLVVVERNKPVIMLAVRHPPGPVVERTPVITPAPVQRPLYGHERLDPDDPVWDRDRGFYNR